MARLGLGRFGWLLLAAACANVGPTVYSTPPPPEPPPPGLVFPMPEPGEHVGINGLAVGYGGYGLEFVARAETGPDGHADRALAGVIDGKLITRDARTGALTAIPVEGGAPSVIAPAVHEGAPIAGDAGGIYWAALDGSIWQAPDRRLGSVPGSPRFLYVDATDVHVFASTQDFPYDVGLALWTIPRAGGAPRAVAELPGRDGVVPAQRPVEGADAFYFTQARSVLRLSKHGELSHVAEVGEKLVPSNAAGYHLEALLVDRGVVYLKDDAYHLLCAPVKGGAAVIATHNAPWIDSMWAEGDHMYLGVEGSIHVAPRAGGTWRLVASVARPVRDVFDRGGKLYVLGDRTLVRVDPIVNPERRLLHDELESLMALAGRGPNLYYTLSETTPEIWAVPKKGGQPRRVTATPDLGAAPVFDGDFIYLLDEDGSLLRAPLGGGPTTELAKQSPNRASVERDYRRGEDLLPQIVGVDGGFVYWLDQERGALMRLPKTGGAAQAAAQGLGRPTRLAVGDGFAAVETADDRTWSLLRVPLAPPGPAQPLAKGDNPIPFAVVGRDLRWAVGDQVFGQTADGAPFPVHLSGYSRRSRIADLAFKGDTLVLIGEYGRMHSESPGRDAVRVLADGHEGPTMLIVDDDAVYFADTGYYLQHKSEMSRADCCSIWAAPR